MSPPPETDMNIQNYFFASLCILAAAGCDGDAEETTAATTDASGTEGQTTDETPTTVAGDDTSSTTDDSDVSTSIGTAEPSTTAASDTEDGDTEDGDTEDSDTEDSDTEDSDTEDAAGSGPVTVTWSEVDITSGCFLFVDPNILGEAAVWEQQEGEAISLVFDAMDTIDYVGSPTESGLVLDTQDSDVFAEETWVFTQSFEGTVSDGHFTGTWSYVECNETIQPEMCPAPEDGCTGTATFDIELP